MASEVISGFDSKKSEPVDIKELVANQAARLALQYPYLGLLVKEADTLKVYKYITVTPIDGSIPSNTGADWERYIQLYTSIVAPLVGVGADDDINIDLVAGTVYKKVAGAWIAQFSADGADIIHGAGAPANELGAVGDMYIRTDNSNQYYEKTDVDTWTSRGYLQGSAGLHGTRLCSGTNQSINLNTLPTGGTNKTINNVFDQLEYNIGNVNYYIAGWSIGQEVIVANSLTDYFIGKVYSWDGSGILVVSVTSKVGTGTFASWKIGINGAQAGSAGKGFTHTAFDINFGTSPYTPAQIQAGVWTPENPWSASIATDSRANKAAQGDSISGDMKGRSISWNGSSWINNGLWRGIQGVAATVAIGTTTTLPPNSQATVVNVGNSNAAIINFGIPQGLTGPSGGYVTREYNVGLGYGNTLIVPAESVGTVVYARLLINVAAGSVGPVNIILPNTIIPVKYSVIIGINPITSGQVNITVVGGAQSFLKPDGTSVGIIVFNKLLGFGTLGFIYLETSNAYNAYVILALYPEESAIFVDNTNINKSLQGGGFFSTNVLDRTLLVSQQAQTFGTPGTVQMTPGTFCKPYIRFRIMAYSSDSGNREAYLTCIIYRTTVTGTYVLNIASEVFRVNKEGPVYIDMETIDVTAVAGTTYYYRLHMQSAVDSVNNKVYINTDYSWKIFPANHLNA